MMQSYLGVDFSTQQLKLLAIDGKFNTLKEICISFDEDLKEYNTKGGVHIHNDKLTVTVPTKMWVQALDVGLERLKETGFDFSTVAAISGTGQQHGSVYWKKGAKAVLNNLDNSLSLHEQLANQFSIPNSPIWMDSSTSAECRYLEKCLGGKQALSDITGSTAYERFTGNQIRKIFTEQQEAYDNTERISLVSSFAASLFLGDYAAIDYSDGSGMNILDIRKKKWDPKCTESIAVGLQNKLGEPVSSSSSLGCISSYYCKKYGFNPSCKIIAFTGDNPASLAGCRLQKGDVVVSLGTSDTLILWIDDPKPSIEGHIFVNPISDNSYMALLCFKNGSLVRERFRQTYSSNSWESFSAALKETPPTNNGNIGNNFILEHTARHSDAFVHVYKMSNMKQTVVYFGIFFDAQEIIPNAVGQFRFDNKDKKVSSFSKKEEIRSLVEGQFMAKRYHAEKLGYKLASSSRILATGGASNNKEILQVLSDVFQAPVYTLDTSNSACLGCAYRAKHGLLGGNSIEFSSIFDQSPAYQLAAKPNQVKYDIERYGRLESSTCSGS